MNLMTTIEESLKAYPGLAVKFDPDGHADNRVDLPNGESYTIDLDDFEDYEEFEPIGSESFGGNYKRPKSIFDHVTLMDAILYAMNGDGAVRKAITGLITDGDHHDCEAIFNYNGNPSILKIRC